MAKSKGFRTGQGEQKTAHINFAEGHRLHGIELDVQLRVPVGVILGASTGNLAEALHPFVKRITSWNLEDDNGPIPVSMEAFGENFSTEEATDLLTAWVEAVTQPSAPLGD